jgi:micrococcal nuclease
MLHTHEVTGSNPVGPTNEKPSRASRGAFPFRSFRVQPSWRRWFAAALVAVVAGPVFSQKAAGDLPWTFTGKVVAVKDGDTIEVMHEGRPVRVRLAHVDCPEGGQPFGKAARQYTSALCHGRTVRVERTDRPDRYGRAIALVHVDGSCVNRALVSAGYAWHYTAYSKDASYAALEREARVAGRGLWADPHAMAPWEWRKQRRNR